VSRMPIAGTGGWNCRIMAAILAVTVGRYKVRRLRASSFNLISGAIEL
jgi:hypothetical protein